MAAQQVPGDLTACSTLWTESELSAAQPASTTLGKQTQFTLRWMLLSSTPKRPLQLIFSKESLWFPPQARSLGLLGARAKYDQERIWVPKKKMRYRSRWNEKCNWESKCNANQSGHESRQRLSQSQQRHTGGAAATTKAWQNPTITTHLASSPDAADTEEAKKSTTASQPSINIPEQKLSNPRQLTTRHLKQQLRSSKVFQCSESHVVKAKHYKKMRHSTITWKRRWWSTIEARTTGQAWVWSSWRGCDPWPPVTK